MKQKETNMKELLTTYLAVEEEKIETKLLQDPVETPVFDKTFYEKLDQAASHESKKTTPRKHIIPKVAAACAFLLIATCLMNPMTRTYAANAFDHLFTWLKQEGPQGTDIYTLESNTKTTTVEMTHIQPEVGYMPKGFEYDEKDSFVGEDMFYYKYVRNSSDKKETFAFALNYATKNEKLALNNEWDYSENVTINGLDYSFNYSYIKDAKWLDIIVYCFDKNVVLDFGYSCTPCDGKDDKTILPKKEFIKIIKNLEY